ncbi:MAG: MurR/RpiR family transcriptional regulator, partial [Thermodesulfobacteriota bacterium]|nr:MurR/RpiR family transcriptional regulator [Thermodesulfobacteriota bacterium]
MRDQMHPILKSLSDNRAKLTPKGRVIADHIIKYPRKAIFMTTKELSETCKVSEATVVRFVSHVGYATYSEFQQSLRDFVDTELTLLDRIDIADLEIPGGERFRRVIFEEMDNLKQLYETLDMEALNRIINLLQNSTAIYVIGSRLSYTFAYYMGWSLTKIRKNIHILRGSDSTTLDWLTIAPSDSLVVIIATSRYPNELIKIGKFAIRLGYNLVTITDSAKCPLIQFSHETLTAPSHHIPFIGSLSAISCLINYISLEIASRMEKNLKAHQKNL